VHEQTVALRQGAVDDKVVGHARGPIRRRRRDLRPYIVDGPLGPAGVGSISEVLGQRTERLGCWRWGGRGTCGRGPACSSRHPWTSRPITMRVIRKTAERKGIPTTIVACQRAMPTDSSTGWRIRHRGRWAQTRLWAFAGPPFASAARMQLRLTQGEGERVLDLSEGRYSLGGEPTDDIQVSQLPGAFMQLFIEGTAWSFSSPAALEVSGVVAFPDVRRLVLPGESLALPGGHWLRSEAPETPGIPGGTQAVLRGWMGSAEPPEGTVPALTCLTGLDLGHSWPLGHLPLRIGRGAEADVRLRDRFVSRIHAELFSQEGRHWLRSLGGVNPLLVKGAVVLADHPLHPGDIVSLGRTQLRYSAPVGPKPQEPSLPQPVAASGTVPMPPPMQGSNPWPWIALGFLLVALGIFLGIGPD
jgi:hypothetical protein